MEIIIDADMNHRGYGLQMDIGACITRYLGDEILFGSPRLVKDVRYVLFKIRPQFP